MKHVTNKNNHKQMNYSLIKVMHISDIRRKIMKCFIILCLYYAESPPPPPNKRKGEETG